MFAYSTQIVVVTQTSYFSSRVGGEPVTLSIGIGLAVLEIFGLFAPKTSRATHGLG
jgi:anaerobic C4-dicarboxylate transporter